MTCFPALITEETFLLQFVFLLYQKLIEENPENLSENIQGYSIYSRVCLYPRIILKIAFSWTKKGVQMNFSSFMYKIENICL